MSCYPRLQTAQFLGVRSLGSAHLDLELRVSLDTVVKVQASVLSPQGSARQGRPPRPHKAVSSAPGFSRVRGALPALTLAAWFSPQRQVTLEPAHISRSHRMHADKCVCLLLSPIHTVVPGTRIGQLPVLRAGPRQSTVFPRPV